MATAKTIEFVEEKQPYGSDGSPLAAGDYVFRSANVLITVRVNLNAIWTKDGGQLAPDEVKRAAQAFVEMIAEHALIDDKTKVTLDSAAMEEVAERLGWQERFYPVSVSDYRSSVEEWHRARSVPVQELPPISEEQRQYLRKIGFSEEEHRRGLLAGAYGNKRQRAKARRLGERVHQYLKEIGKQFNEQYWLIGIRWEVDRLRWLLKIQTPDRVVGVPVPFELADDVVDAEILTEQERLREGLLSGLGKARLSA